MPPQNRKPTEAHPVGTVRKDLHRCNGCRKQYTVAVGTLFERSKIALNKWVLATFLLCSSMGGLPRELGERKKPYDKH